MEKANRLINEKSPYLLQHADNPVDWYPWGEEAFSRAKAEDKPVFLSIGYSTCHWCHVMAHESFENPEIATILNNRFVCIKVDREERPDVDQMYMAATQAMTGSGGWPMSVFLFPDGRPFWAATYIPPRTQSGRPGFPDILEAVHAAWKDRRDELQHSAGRMLHLLQGEQHQPASAVQDDVWQRAYDFFVAAFDTGYGGFGSGPKFPRPVALDFLFRTWRNTGEPHALDMALATLSSMARGGMYDHLGGGFHRYSVDGQWRIPHFEKMLYDQAQLAEAYLDGYLITSKTEYADTAREIFRYLLRDMRDPAGGFYSAEDADSEDPYASGQRGEGAYYLWTKNDIVKTVSASDADIFNYCYGVHSAGNALADPQQEFVGRNILFLEHTSEEAVTRFGQDCEKIKAALERARGKLFATRLLRTRPHLDDKIVTGWNGLVIGALARGGAILDDPELVRAAAVAADFVHDRLYNSTTRTLQRRFCRGEAGFAGQLDDYAFLVAGLLKLYRVEQQPQYLQWAVDLTTTQIELFWDKKNSGFYDAPEDTTVVVRMKSDYDGAEPAPNSVAAENLVRIGRMTDNRAWLELAEQTVNGFSSQINTSPQALVRMLDVLRELTAKPRQVVIAGRQGAEDSREMLSVVNKVYDPDRLLLFADAAENQKLLGTFLPFIRTAVMQDNRATAYLCENFTCRMPLTSPDELAEELERGAGTGK